MAYTAKAKFSRRSVACPVSLDGLRTVDEDATWEEELVLCSPSSRGQPWWVLALEGEVAWRRLCRELGLSPGVKYPFFTFRERISRGGCPFWECLLYYWPPGAKRARWGRKNGQQVKYVPKRLLPLVRSAWWFVKFRHKLEGLLGA